MALLSTDPVTVKMTTTGDRLVVDVAALASSDAFATGLDAVVVGVRTRLLLIAGEWFLNLDAGVAWFEADGVAAERVIIGSKYNEASVRAELLLAIRDTPGVVDVNSLMIQFDPSDRCVTITWSVRTAFGDTEPDTLLVSMAP